MDGAFELPIHITYRPPGWLVVAVIASYVVYWRKYVLCEQLPPPLELILNSEDVWKLVDATGAREVQLLPESLVHPALLVLRFQERNRVHPFILTSRTVDRDVLRRLRVR